MIRIAIVDDEREILELLFRIIDDTLKGNRRSLK